MKKYQEFFSLLIALIFFASISCPALAQSYKKYCNGRFGFCVEYPEDFGMEPVPTNNDGRVFYDGEGFRMSANGIDNVMDETLKSEMLSQEQNFDTISYRTSGNNWYVLSGLKGNEIIYLKTFVGKGAINHLHISYPSRMKAEYESIVTRISRSFVPGSLDDAH
jgi:hypothetical protein